MGGVNIGSGGGLYVLSCVFLWFCGWFQVGVFVWGVFWFWVWVGLPSGCSGVYGFDVMFLIVYDGVWGEWVGGVGVRFLVSGYLFFVGWFCTVVLWSKRVGYLLGAGEFRVVFLYCLLYPWGWFVGECVVCGRCRVVGLMCCFA